jgi:hypothetical protein
LTGDKRAIADAQPLLDVLRPPKGFRVRYAALATYSLDVVVGAAVMMAAAGFGEDDGSKVDFADSLIRMRDRLRFVAQEGRVGTSRPEARVVALLDRFVRTRRMDEKDGAWHPKMAVVSFEEDPDVERDPEIVRTGPPRPFWRIWLGSRNLTTHVAIDIGLVLESTGVVGKPPTGLDDAVYALLLVAELPGIDAEREADRCAALGWSSPPGVTVHEVRWMEEASRQFPEPLDAAGGVLHAVSPFLDARGLAMLGKWPAPRRTLLTTSVGLDEVGDWRHFRGFDVVRTMEPVDEDPAAWTEEERTASEEDDAVVSTVGLHAKLIVVVKPDRFEAWVGSANLSRRGWMGPNVEVVARVGGTRNVYDALGLDVLLEEHAVEVTRQPDRVEPTDEERTARRLEVQRARVAARWDVVQRLRRRTPTLMAKADPLAVVDGDVALRVGLVGSPLVDWPRGVLSLDLADVDRAEETELVCLELSAEGQAVRWLARAPREDGIPEDRDHRALLRHMGPRAFLEWIRGMLVGEADEGGGDWDKTNAPDRKGDLQGDGVPYWAPSLEDVLRSWARDGGVAVRRADDAVKRYLGVLRGELAEDEDARAHLLEFEAHWTRIVTALLEDA